MSHRHDVSVSEVAGGSVSLDEAREAVGLLPLVASLEDGLADFAFRGIGNRGFRLNRRRFVEAEWLRDRKGRFLKFIGLPRPGQRRQSNWGTDAEGNETPNFQVAKAFRSTDSDEVLAYARPIAPLNNQQQVVVEVGRSVNDLGRNPSPTSREIAQMPEGMPEDLEPGETRYVRLDPKQLEIVSDPTTRAGGRARLPENAAEAEGLGANDPEDAPAEVVDDLDPVEAQALEDEMRALAASQRGPIRDALTEAADLLGGAQEAESLREQENALDAAERRLRRDVEDLGDAMIGRTLASDRLRDFARRVDGLVAKDPIDAFQEWQAPEQGERGTPLAARQGRVVDDAVAAARRRALNQPAARRTEAQRIAQAVQGARDLNKRGLLNPMAARNTEAIATMVEDGRLDWDEDAVPALRALATALDTPDEPSQDDPLARRVLDVAGTTGDADSTRALRNAALGLLNEPGDERRAELVNVLSAVRERVDDPAVDSALASLAREAGGDPEARERLTNVPRASLAPEQRATMPEAPEEVVPEAPEEVVPEAEAPEEVVPEVPEPEFPEAPEPDLDERGLDEAARIAREQMLGTGVEDWDDLSDEDQEAWRDALDAAIDSVGPEGSDEEYLAEADRVLRAASDETPPQAQAFDPRDTFPDQTGTGWEELDTLIAEADDVTDDWSVGVQQYVRERLNDAMRARLDAERQATPEDQAREMRRATAALDNMMSRLDDVEPYETWFALRDRVAPIREQFAAWRRENDPDFDVEEDDIFGAWTESRLVEPEAPADEDLQDQIAELRRRLTGEPEGTAPEAAPEPESADMVPLADMLPEDWQAQDTQGAEGVEVSWSPDGRWSVRREPDGTIEVYDRETGDLFYPVADQEFAEQLDEIMRGEGYPSLRADRGDEEDVAPEGSYTESASALRDAIEQSGDLANLPEVVNAADAVDAITDESGGITPNADSQVLSDVANVLDDADIAVGDSGDTSEAAQDLSSALQDTADAVEAEADARAAAEQASGEGPPRVPLGDSREMSPQANPNGFLEGSDQEQINAAQERIERDSNGAGQRFSEAKRRYQEAIANGDEDAAAQAMADAQQALSDWAAEAQANGQVAAANKARALSRRIGTQLRKAGYPRTRIDRRNQPRARQRRAAAAERRRNRRGEAAPAETEAPQAPEVSTPEAEAPPAPATEPTVDATAADIAQRLEAERETRQAATLTRIIGDLNSGEIDAATAQQRLRDLARDLNRIANSYMNMDRDNIAERFLEFRDEVQGLADRLDRGPQDAGAGQQAPEIGAPATPEASTDEPTRDTVADAVAESPASTTTEAQVRSSSNENDIAEAVRSDPASNAARAERREGGDPDPAVEDALAQSGAISDVEPSQMPPVVSPADAAMSAASAARSAALSASDFASQMDAIDQAVQGTNPSAQRNWDRVRGQLGDLTGEESPRQARKKANRLLFLSRDFVSRANAARTGQERQQFLDLAQRSDALLNAYLDTTGIEIDGYTRTQDQSRAAQARIEQVMATPEPSGGWFYMDDYFDEADYSDERSALQGVLDALGAPTWANRFSDDQPAAMLDQVRRDLAAMLGSDLGPRQDFFREERFERMINKINRLASATNDPDLAALRDTLLGVRFRSRGGVDDGAWDLDNDTLQAVRDATIQFMGTGTESGIAMNGAKKALDDALAAEPGSEARWAALMRARNQFDLVHATQAVPLMNALRVRVNPDRLREMADPTFRLTDGNIAPRRPAPRGRAWDGGEIARLADEAAALLSEAANASGVRADGLTKASRSLRQAVNAYNQGRYGDFEAFYSLALSRAMQAGDRGAFQRLAALREEHWGEYDWGAQAADVRAGLLEQMGFLPRSSAVTPRDPRKAAAMRHRQNARAALAQALQQPDGSFEQRAMLDRALWSLRQADDPRDRDLRDLLAPYDPNGDVRDAAPSRRNPNDGGDGGGLPPGAPGDMRVARAQQAFRILRGEGFAFTSDIAERTGLDEDQARELMQALLDLDLVVSFQGANEGLIWAVSDAIVGADGDTLRPRSAAEIDDLILRGLTEDRRSTPQPTAPPSEPFALTDPRVTGDETGLSIPEVGSATPNEDGTWTVVGFETETGAPAIEFGVADIGEAEQRLGQLADLRDRFAQAPTPAEAETPTPAETEIPTPTETETPVPTTPTQETNLLIDDVIDRLFGPERTRMSRPTRRVVGDASDSVEEALADVGEGQGSMGDVADRLDELADQLDVADQADLADRARAAATSVRAEEAERQRQEAEAEAERQRQEAEAEEERQRQEAEAEAVGVTDLGGNVLAATGDTEVEGIINQAAALQADGDTDGARATLVRASDALLRNAGLAGKVSQGYEPDQTATVANAYADIRLASPQPETRVDYSSALAHMSALRVHATPEQGEVLDRVEAALGDGDPILAESILTEASRNVVGPVREAVLEIQRRIRNARPSGGENYYQNQAARTIASAAESPDLTADQQALVTRAQQLAERGDAIGAANVLRMVSLQRLESNEVVPALLTAAQRSAREAVARDGSPTLRSALTRDLVAEDPAMADVLGALDSPDIFTRVEAANTLGRALDRRIANPSLTTEQRREAARRMVILQPVLDGDSRALAQASALLPDGGDLVRRPALGEAEGQFVVGGVPLVPGDLVRDRWGDLLVVNGVSLDSDGNPVASLVNPATGDATVRGPFGLQFAGGSPTIADPRRHFGPGGFLGSPTEADTQAWVSRFGATEANAVAALATRTPAARVLLDPDGPAPVREQALIDMMTSPSFGAGTVASVEVGDGTARITVGLGDEGRLGDFTVEITRGDEGLPPVIRVTPATSSPTQASALAQENALRAAERYGIANGAASIQVDARRPASRYSAASAGYDWDEVAMGGFDSTRATVLDILERAGVEAEGSPGVQAAVADMIREAEAATDLNALPTPFEIASLGASQGGRPSSRPGYKAIGSQAWTPVRMLSGPNIYTDRVQQIREREQRALVEELTGELGEHRREGILRALQMPTRADLASSSDATRTWARVMNFVSVGSRPATPSLAVRTRSGTSNTADYTMYEFGEAEGVRREIAGSGIETNWETARSVAARVNSYKKNSKRAPSDEELARFLDQTRGFTRDGQQVPGSEVVAALGGVEQAIKKIAVVRGDLSRDAASRPREVPGLGIDLSHAQVLQAYDAIVPGSEGDAGAVRAALIEAGVAAPEVDRVMQASSPDGITQALRAAERSLARGLTHSGNGSLDFSGERAHPGYLALDDSIQGNGVAKRLQELFGDWGVVNGIEYMATQANIDVGMYAWSASGFDWEATGESRRRDASMLLRYIGNAVTTDEERALVREMQERVDTEDPSSAEFPTPFEIVHLGIGLPGALQSGNWLGKRGLVGARGGFYARKYLRRRNARQQRLGQMVDSAALFAAQHRRALAQAQTPPEATPEGGAPTGGSDGGGGGVGG